MRLGYSITSAHSRERSPSAVASTLVDRAHVASDAGFDYVQAGDHHVTADRHYFQNVPTLARLTEVIDHVAALVLLPIHDPVVVAEQCGTLAAFADRFELWCALGYEEGEFDAFGVPKAQRVPRFVESLELIEALWSQDDVTIDGDFRTLEGVSVNPKASPERLCIGGRAEPAVRRAGRLGDGWVAGAESRSALERKREWFDAAGGGDVLVRRDALVLEDGDRARELADRTLREGYRGWDVDTEGVLAGDPAFVADELRALSEVGVDEVVIRPMCDDHAIETLRSCGRALDRLVD